MRIGIPRGLMFYNFIPFWYHFFRELGFEVVVSGRTERGTLDAGVTNSVDETCLPVKLFIGHVLRLAGSCDMIFIPSIRSVEPKRYLCPKIMAVSSLFQSSLLDLPPLLTPVIDNSHQENNWRESFLQLGYQLTRNRHKSQMAYKKATLEQQRFTRVVTEGWLPSFENGVYSFAGEPPYRRKKRGLRIGLIGHGYLIFDPFISMGLIDKVARLGGQIVLSDQLTDEMVEKYTKDIKKDLFWTYGKKLLAAGKYFNSRSDIDGSIFVTAFGCGPDAIVQPFITDVEHKPMMVITLDELTGEAGVQTRLEAFFDMLKWRSYRESRISAHG